MKIKTKFTKRNIDKKMFYVISNARIDKQEDKGIIQSSVCGTMGKESGDMDAQGNESGATDVQGVALLVQACRGLVWLCVQLSREAEMQVSQQVQGAMGRVWTHNL